MALEGSLKDFGLADILQLIFFQRKTGVLTLEGRMDRIRLLVIEGNIAGAESKRRTDDNRLGKILVKKGLISDHDLQTALEEQGKSGGRLGNVLVRMEFVDKEAIRGILKNQATETVLQAFSWNHGTYEFESQGVPADKEFSFSLDTEHLLMEGMRLVDELSGIKGKLTIDTVFRKKSEEVAGLSEDETEILEHVDGENDVSTIIDITAKDNFQVSSALASLVDKGIIEEVEEAPVAAGEDVPAAIKPLPFAGILPFLAILFSIIISFLVVRNLPVNFIPVNTAASEVDSLRFSIEEYRIINLWYPEKLEKISLEKDPWGNSYVYRASEDSFYVASPGPDGREGTGDDIF